VTRPTAALYARVSTAEQSVDRQVHALHEYAERELPECELVEHIDRSTGTDTDRQGFRDMLDGAGELDHVVVHEVSRLARSIGDLDRTVDELHAAGTGVHIVSEGLHLPADDTDPYSRALTQLLGVFAELDAAIIRDRVRQGIAARQQGSSYHHGPAPLGYRKDDDGELVRSDEWDSVRRVLRSVELDTMSVSAAADRLDTSRKTVHRCLQHPDRYDLDVEPAVDEQC
jgi:DNA invertase Pin-like site-specific DNA recombinase